MEKHSDARLRARAESCKKFISAHAEEILRLTDIIAIRQRVVVKEIELLKKIYAEQKRRRPAACGGKHACRQTACGGKE